MEKKHKQQEIRTLDYEYTYRYSKVHTTDSQLRDILKTPPINIPDNKIFKQPPQCMPEKYKGEDSVVAYQKFYLDFES